MKMLSNKRKTVGSNRKVKIYDNMLCFISYSYGLKWGITSCDQENPHILQARPGYIARFAKRGGGAPVLCLSVVA